MGDRLGMGDRHSADRLHGLDRDGRLKVKTYKDLEEAEGNEDPERVHLIQRDISDHEGDQSPQISKGPCELHPVVIVPPEPHDRSRLP